MVNIKEIKKNLGNLKENSDKLKYLNKIIDETKDKDLIKQIKELINEIKELESVFQIETKGKVEWSIPEDEGIEERRTLERQVISFPLEREEEKDNRIEYELQGNVDLYKGVKSSESGIRYEGINRRLDLNEGKSFIERSSNFEERINKQYLSNEDNLSQNDERRIDNIEKYETSFHELKSYVSVSQQVHDQKREKIKKGLI